MDTCRFCTITEQLDFETAYYVAIPDQNPVSKGHTILVLKRHEASLFNVTQEEWADLDVALKKAKELLDAKHKPDGYNVGVNIEEAGGQSVPHLHIHVFPRYTGDVVNPRGGIRHFMKPIKELPETYS